MNVQELLWKCAEGECSPKEQAELETMLASDPALQQEFESIQAVQFALKNMETEQPSMRFVQNVMETLPQNLYSPVAAESLVSPVWKKIFGVALAAVVVLIMWLSRSADQPSASSNLPLAEDFSQRISHVFGQIPAATMQYFVLVLAAIATILFLDKIMKVNKLKHV